MSSITDFLQLAAQNVWVYGGTFLLVLSILVFVHEWGHYIVARKCGVKVDSFSIGFGKEIFGFTDRHGTRWRFSIIPLGGYVKMFGDVDPASAGHSDQVIEDGKAVRAHSAEERKVAFYAQSVGKRAAIVFAGPAINFLFAIAILWGLYVFYGQPVTAPTVAAIVADSAAQKAGFQPHDEVLSIDGQPVRRFEDIRREVVVGLDRQREFVVKRGDAEVTIKALPERKIDEDRFGFKHTRGYLGLISLGNAFAVDRVVAVDGEKVTDADAARAALLEKMGQSFVVEVNLAAATAEGAAPKTEKYLIHPIAADNAGLKDPASPDYGKLHISKADKDIFVHHGVVDGLMEAVHQTAGMTLDTLGALGQIVTGTRPATELGGVIRIGAIAGDMAQAGFIALITFTAILSINLGLINLFPIPMLDGGHLVFYAAEAARGAPVPEKVQEYAFRAGLVVLVCLMVFANLNDIVQLIL